MMMSACEMSDLESVRTVLEHATEMANRFLSAHGFNSWEFEMTLNEVDQKYIHKSVLCLTLGGQAIQLPIKYPYMAYVAAK